MQRSLNAKFTAPQRSNVVGLHMVHDDGIRQVYSLILASSLKVVSDGHGICQGELLVISEQRILLVSHFYRASSIL